jgi:hypothetical protein
MFKLEGTEFRLFWDMDRPKLAHLSFSGRAEWLQLRTVETLLKPLDVLKRAEGEALVWLAGTELICAGIHSLAGFYGNGRHGLPGTSFCRFVHTFMHRDFYKTEKNIKGELWSYCQHLETYFRNPLDHGFAIEWGGIWNDGENGMMGYLRPCNDGKGIAIDPRLLLEDFRQAVNAYFQKLTSEGENSLLGENFQKRFNAILSYQGKKY